MFGLKLRWYLASALIAIACGCLQDSLIKAIFATVALELVLAIIITSIEEN